MKKIILIIDDDQGIRDALSELFEMEGYKVELAENGNEGLKCLRSMSSGPDLILLDLMMPNMDGFQFREKQKAEALKLDVPVILMSADGQLKDKQILAGVTDHLRKPMDIAEAIEIVKRYCR